MININNYISEKLYIGKGYGKDACGYILIFRSQSFAGDQWKFCENKYDYDWFIDNNKNSITPRMRIVVPNEDIKEVYKYCYGDKMHPKMRPTLEDIIKYTERNHYKRESLEDANNYEWKI